jgi:adenosylcobyric acid synthase
VTGPALMVCGTASDVGKSRLVTGLCRALARRGLKVAPFKGQNMALNSVVTPDGAEIGRAQGTQAQAAGVVAEAAMNPVLLKPTTDRRSQVVVLGRPWRELDAAAFHRAKQELGPLVLDALGDLRARHDVVVCEGAGSPAEINLFDGDLVNLGLAVQAGVPAVLVGDIDRGGVFAHLYGTVALLPEDRRAAVRGFVVNKLRGDPLLLGDATEVLRRRTGIATLGVVPYLHGLWLDAEDSLGLGWPSPPSAGTEVVVDVAVVRLPRIANFTDLDPLAAEGGVGVRLVDHPGALGDPDLVVLPGTKSTVADLEWLRRRGLGTAIEARRRSGTVVVGICGGYQMLGDVIEDPDGVESTVPSTPGLGLLGLRTRFDPVKVTARRSGTSLPGGEAVEGYEIHHGRTATRGEAWFDLDAGPEGLRGDGVYGSILHGLFEADGFRAEFLSAVAARRGKAWRPAGVSYDELREAQIDRLADACERHLDMDALLAIAGEAR